MSTTRIKRQRLTAENAARCVRAAREVNERLGGTRLPVVFDAETFEWRPLTRGEIALGERYLQRLHTRLVERIRHTSNVRAMHKVATASGLPA